MLVLVLVPAMVRADPPSSCHDKMAVRTEALKRGAEEGVWLPTKDANRVYFVLSECLPGYERFIDAQARLIDAQTKTIKTSSRALDLSEEIQQDEHERGEAWKEDAIDTRKLLKEERERADSFFRSPTLWFGIGAAVSAAIAIGIAVGMAHAQPKGS